MWDDYRTCCRAVAADDRDAVFCPACGHALLRCLAPDCRRLVTPLGHCASCIDLRLSLEKGAILKAGVGECLSLPFVVANNAPVRPVSVKSVLMDGTDLPQDAVPVGWKQLEPGQARTLTVATGPFAHAGVNRLNLLLIVAAVFGEVEESYAFSGGATIDVEGAEPSLIDLRGAVFSPSDSGMIAPRVITSGPLRKSREADALGARACILLERADRYEIEHGHRGYGQLAARIPRNVQFLFAGFPANDRPSDGPLLQGPVIRCGRNGRPGHVQPDVQPNDLCLRLYDPSSGDLDREASAGISRRACDFVLANDRLYVRGVSEAGLALNDRHLAAGEMHVVSHGDSVKVAAAGGRTLTIAAAFKVAGGLVTHVRFEKGS